jgi:hypothetical protein
MIEEKLMTEKEWKEKQKKKTKKKYIRNALALVLVAVISVVGTLAYLSKKTDPTTNTFTGSAGLRLGLTEPNWENSNDTAKDGGKSKAENYTPDLVIAKNPILYNASSVTINGTYPDKSAAVTADNSYKYNEYVAMRIDFTDGSNHAITYGALLNVIKPINFDTNNWKLVKILKDGTTTWSNASNIETSKIGSTAANGDITAPTSEDVKAAKSMIFVYKGDDLTTLAANGATSALFTQIQIREGTSDQQIKDLTGKLDSGISNGTTLIGDFPTFNIVVEGAAVDKASYGTTTTSVETDLFNLLKKSGED